VKAFAAPRDLRLGRVPVPVERGRRAPATARGAAGGSAAPPQSSGALASRALAIDARGEL